MEVWGKSGYLNVLKNSLKVITAGKEKQQLGIGDTILTQWLKLTSPIAGHGHHELWYDAVRRIQHHFFSDTGAKNAWEMSRENIIQTQIEDHSTK